MRAIAFHPEMMARLENDALARCRQPIHDTISSPVAWFEQDLERKEAPKTGYEISERAETSRRTKYAKLIAVFVLIAGTIVLARKRGQGWIGTLRARVRQQLRSA